MNRKPWLRLLAAAIIATVPVVIASKVFPTAQVPTGAPLQTFTAHLDSRIPDIMNDYKIPGLSVALIQKGKIVWTQAYGFADIEAGRYMTVDTYCRMESISKSVTAWGVMKLVGQGLVDLDKPVETYLKTWALPQSPYNEDEVTVRTLLNGSSGMPLGTIGKLYSPAAGTIPPLREVLTEEAVLFQEPGSAFFYSNTGFNILELVIEEVTGRSFVEYMHTEVIDPLGMNEASFEWSQGFEPPVANGYDNRGDAIPVYVYPYNAAGDLFGTIDDIARFTIAGMTDYSDVGQRVLSPDTIEMMFTPAAEMSSYYRYVFDGYGFGHFIQYAPIRNGGNSAGNSQSTESKKMIKILSHGGQGTGWMTDFHFAPETGDGIVILSNSQRTWPGFAYILSDWAGWIGLSGIGMGVIILVQKIAWISIAVVLTLLVWQVLHLRDGLISGSRAFAPFSGTHRTLQFVQYAVAFMFFSVFLWIMSLEYWFIDSVLPIATHWLKFTILSAAFVVVASAIFPRYKKR